MRLAIGVRPHDLGKPFGTRSCQFVRKSNHDRFLKRTVAWQGRVAHPHPHRA
jgi:hypothetical protein